MHEFARRNERVRSGACTCLVVDNVMFREHVYPLCRKHPNAPPVGTL